MKNYIYLIVGVCLFQQSLFVSSAQAYESDSHLRISYVLARAAGINDETAKYLSIGNQYVDETALTSAMLLSSQRQLYHFHGDAADIASSGHGSTNFLSRFVKSKLALAERNHALGSLFLYHGLVNGDLQLFSAGTHTKMDTFGHAGYSNLLGHAPDGHSPDRAFLEPKKYEDMIREMLLTYVALKEVLPPELIDNRGALEYLNKHAERTHLGRKLTEADMKDAVIIATAVLGDAELQSIYRENIYKKYEYKKLALERVFQSFRTQGKINADVTFNEVFPEEFIRNASAETTDVIIQSIMKYGQSEFLKTAEGKDIFDMSRMLEGKTEAQFMREYEMEVRAYEGRLKEIVFMEARLESLTGLERQALEERIESEKLRLLSGLGDSAQHDVLTEVFIEARAKELAQYKIAESMANHLTKDLIPRKTNEYIKHQFEDNGDNRLFENHYKDESYRRFIDKNFGVNWVMAEGRSKIMAVLDAMKTFKRVILRQPIPENAVAGWKVAAEKAATDLIRDPDLNERDKAQIISFNTRNKIAWAIKHLKYVVLASIPIYGVRYVAKLSEEAKKNALEHRTEDMREAVRTERYRPDIVGTTTAAANNIRQIRAGTKVRCSYWMNLISAR